MLIDRIKQVELNPLDRIQRMESSEFIEESERCGQWITPADIMEFGSELITRLDPFRLCLLNRMNAISILLETLSRFASLFRSSESFQTESFSLKFAKFG